MTLVLVGAAFTALFLLPPFKHPVFLGNSNTLDIVRNYHATGDIGILRNALDPSHKDMSQAHILMSLRLRQTPEEMAFLRGLLHASPSLQSEVLAKLGQITKPELQLPLIAIVSPFAKSLPLRIDDSFDGDEFGKQLALRSQAIGILVGLKSPESKAYITQRVLGDSDTELVNLFLSSLETKDPRLCHRLNKILVKRHLARIKELADSAPPTR